MWRSFMWTLGFLVLVPALQAQEQSKDAPPKDEASSPGEQFKSIMTEMGKARSEIVKEFQAAAGDSKKQDELRAKYFALPGTFAPRVLALAEKNPKDAIAYDALVWIVTNAADSKAADKAVDMLIRDHLEQKGLVQVCMRMQSSDSAAAEKFLRAALEKSPHEDVQAHACYSLAKVIVERAGADEKRQAEAEKLFERVAKEFGEVRFGRQTLAEAVEDDLYILKNLAVGKVAPEIEAEDIDGETFALSDYRGKVVMLDFWGHW